MSALASFRKSVKGPVGGILVAVEVGQSTWNITRLFKGKITFLPPVNCFDVIFNFAFQMPKTAVRRFTRPKQRKKNSVSSIGHHASLYPTVQ